MANERVTRGPLDLATRERIVARLAAVPLARLLGLRLVKLERGACDLAIDDRRDLDGIFASLHGGILATLADSAIAFAALTLIDPDEVVTTVEFNIRFLAPCREGVVARSRVLKAGRTLITGEVDLVGLASETRFAVCGLTYIRLGRPAGVA
jgi:acyl-CoA thioesterase